MQLASADDVIAELLAEPVGAGDVRTLAPAAAGLYAWWASPDVLPTLKGPTHPSSANLRLLYHRPRDEATKSTGEQSPRPKRQLDSTTHSRGLAARWRAVPHQMDGPRRPGRRRRAAADRVDDSAPARDLVRIRDSTRRRAGDHPIPSSTLNVQHASGPARELIQEARRRYYASAGPRTSA